MEFRKDYNETVKVNGDYSFLYVTKIEINIS